MLLYTLSAFDTLPERWSLIWLMSASIVILMTSNLQKKIALQQVSLNLEVKVPSFPVHEGAVGVRQLLQDVATGNTSWVMNRKCKRKKTVWNMLAILYHNFWVYFLIWAQVTSCRTWRFGGGLAHFLQPHITLLSSVIEAFRSINLKKIETHVH